ncbi:MAG TPA: DNA translocase FtsK 4TM domain-containing protein, partial [Bacteroidota bacterium]|nr:DNA translocase FtsK 4TM domain-containing protein [Bacteroidota bacterium]
MAALLMIVAALLVMISLVTYDAGDQSHINLHASDLPGVVTGDQNVRAMADTVHNGLGLVGALMSDFLINATVGYAVGVFPLLILLWGWTILRRGSVRTSLVITNYTVIVAVLVSVSFGMITLIAGAGGPAGEWSGIVGLSLATMLSQLIGKAGGSIVLVAGMLLTAVLAADLDVHETVERLRAAFSRLMEWIENKRDERLEARGQEEEELPASVPARTKDVTITKPRPEDLGEPSGPPGRRRKPRRSPWGRAGDSARARRDRLRLPLGRPPRCAEAGKRGCRRRGAQGERGPPQGDAGGVRRRVGKRERHPRARRHALRAR